MEQTIHRLLPLLMLSIVPTFSVASPLADIFVRLAPLRGLFRQFELVYAIGDERDIIALRANIRGPVLLHPICTTAARVRTLFVSMLQRANRLAVHPQFCDTLTNTRTTNIVRPLKVLWREEVPFDLCIAPPGHAAMACERGLKDLDEILEERRVCFLINSRSGVLEDEHARSRQIRGGRTASVPALTIRSTAEACSVTLDGPPVIGRLRLWVPEAVMSNTGASAIYPVGQSWVPHPDGWSQALGTGDTLFGPGNARRIDAKTIELAGIRFPQDNPVTWTTTVTPDGDGVRFRLRLTNAGHTPIGRAGAAVCLKFLKSSGWRDDRVFVRSGGEVRSLASLGRDAGISKDYEAWLLVGEEFEHAFYREFWGFNTYRLDRPVMVSEYPEEGLCVGIEGDRAYFLHSNPGNPCTDIMLAFGDLPAGATVESTGRVWIRRGRATACLEGDER